MTTRETVRARMNEVDGARVTVDRVERHRNGSSGAPFHVVLFTHRDQRFVGVVFEEAEHVAVLERDLLARGEVGFGVNSWRGALYEPVLRRAIARRTRARGSVLADTADRVKTMER